MNLRTHIDKKHCTKSYLFSEVLLDGTREVKPGIYNSGIDKTGIPHDVLRYGMSGSVYWAGMGQHGPGRRQVLGLGTLQQHVTDVAWQVLRVG